VGLERLATDVDASVFHTAFVFAGAHGTTQGSGALFFDDGCIGRSGGWNRGERGAGDWSKRRAVRVCAGRLGIADGRIGELR
jgi:hypothetical protein